MKLRNSFVTNSSSSSFIISSKSKDNKIQLILEVDLDKSADKKITTIEELNEYADYNWDYNPNDPKSDDYMKEEYDKMKKAIEDGNILFELWGSNESDDPLQQFIYYNGLDTVKLPDGAKVLFGG